MGWTKRDFVLGAFNEIGYASYIFDLKAEQLEAAKVKLDNMMATWYADGIRVGFPLPSSPTSSSLDDETGVPAAAREAITLNLALRLAPTVGKTVSPETKIAAYEAYNSMVNRVVDLPREMQLPETMPAGQGNIIENAVGNPFLSPPVSDIDLEMNDLVGL